MSLELGAILLGHLAPPSLPLSKARKRGGKEERHENGGKRKKRGKTLLKKDKDLEKDYNRIGMVYNIKSLTFNNSAGKKLTLIGVKIGCG